MTTGTTVVPKKPQASGGSSDGSAKTTVKLKADLHRKARTVASDLGIELWEYLDQVLRPIVEKAHKALGDRISKGTD